MIVSDYSLFFMTYEFKVFCTRNGVLHLAMTVYKLTCNGQAERLVQILKPAPTQEKRTIQNPDKLLLCYLLTYRNTPRLTTEESLEMLQYGRRLSAKLDLMFLSVSKQFHKA